MVPEQTYAIPLIPTASLSRQFPTSVLSHEQRHECRPSLPTLRGERTSQVKLLADFLFLYASFILPIA